MKIKIFADGADLKSLQEMSAKVWVKGFTTNPSLMRVAGVMDYVEFAHKALAIVGERPISFEVFADEFDQMEEQARTLSAWGKNVFVKIPVTNTRGESSAPLIARLSQRGVPLNVTALFTIDQMKEVVKCLHDAPAVISVFAGRIADTGVDPLPIMQESLKLLKGRENLELLWASPREIFNLVQAEEIGCHIITLSTDLLKKIPLLGKDLQEFSLETVKMFYKDAMASKYSLESCVCTS